MNLKEWLGIRAYDINEGDTADVFAQLLAYLEKSGDIYISPSDINISDDGELKISASDAFDENYRPVKADGAPADAVIAAGVMLYHKMSGELPDMANAGLLLIGAQSDEDISMCSYPASSADALITAMTKISAGKRPSASKALDMLAALNTSKAVISFAEEQTGTVLCTKEIPLNKGMTVYIPDATDIGTEGVFPVTREIVIPYRRKTLSYTCTVSSEKKMSEEHRTRKTSGRIFAFDAGTRTLTAALFDTDGTLTDIPVPDGDMNKAEAVSQILAMYGFDDNDRTAATDRSGIDADITVDMYDAVSIFTGNKRPCITAYLGSTAYIYVTGADGHKGASSAPLAGKMADILSDDIRNKLKIAHHIDLSDEVIHSAALRDVHSTAVSIMKKLSYSDTADIVLSLRYDGEDRNIPLSYDRYTFESMIRDTVGEVRSSLAEALNMARTDRKDVAQITLMGGAACIPCLADVFSVNDTAITFLHERTAARGAAVCADVPFKKAACLSYDIGILNIPINSNVPVFEVMAKAGTEYDKCSFTYTSDGAKPENIGGREVICLKLYSRKKGMEHVKTPYDPEGSAISFIGKFSAPLPSSFSAHNDRIVINVTADGGKLTVTAVHERRKNAVARFFGRLSGGSEWERAGDIQVI